MGGKNDGIQFRKRSGPRFFAPSPAATRGRRRWRNPDAGFVGQVGRAYADDKPALGTWPAGSQGDSVTIGATVPRTGAYAVQGEDELKGMQLAVEHSQRGQ